MNKKKGFTLMELLVVIVILALMLIIAIPSIINVLEKSKKQAFIESGISIVKSLSTSSSVDQVLGENEIKLPSEGESKNVNLSEVGYENGSDITGSIVITNDSGKYKYYLYITNGEYIICNKEYTSVSKNDVEKGKNCGDSLLFAQIENKYKEQTYNYKYDITEELILNGISASDTRDGNLTDKITYEHNIDTSVLGTYEITYKVKNSLGNETTAKRTIYVKDTKAPTITNEILTDNIDKGSIYESYLTGVSATDNYNNSEDIEITYTCENAAYEKIECSTITNKAGTYYVVYDAKDTSGNEYSESSNEEIKRTISVNDIDAPVITLKGESIIYVEIKGTYTEEGYEAIDDEDGDVTDKVQTTSNLNLNNLGTYQVDYTVEDKSGNIGTATRTIIVQDTTKPTITNVEGNPSDWVTSATLVVNASDNYKLHEEAYSFDGGTTWQASNSKTFSSNVTVNIKVKDTSENISELTTVEITKIDATTPTVSLSGVPSEIIEGESYNLPTSYTVNSNLSGGNVVCKVGSTTVTNTSTLALGTHTVNCTVTTGANKTAVSTKNVTVKSPSPTGTIDILASWPNTTSLVLSLSGVTVESGTVEYQVKIGNIVKCDYSTSKSCTISGLNSATAYSITVNTRNGDNVTALGSTKTVTIYTSKTVTPDSKTVAGTCPTNNNIVVEATDIYEGATVSGNCSEKSYTCNGTLTLSSTTSNLPTTTTVSCSGATSTGTGGNLTSTKTNYSCQVATSTSTGATTCGNRTATCTTSGVTISSTQAVSTCTSTTSSCSLSSTIANSTACGGTKTSTCNGATVTMSKACTSTETISYYACSVPVKIGVSYSYTVNSTCNATGSCTRYSSSVVKVIYNTISTSSYCNSYVSSGTFHVTYLVSSIMSAYNSYSHSSCHAANSSNSSYCHTSVSNAANTYASTTAFPNAISMAKSKCYKLSLPVSEITVSVCTASIKSSYVFESAAYCSSYASSYVSGCMVGVACTCPCSGATCGTYCGSYCPSVMSNASSNCSAAGYSICKSNNTSTIIYSYCTSYNYTVTSQAYDVMSSSLSASGCNNKIYSYTTNYSYKSTWITGYTAKYSAVTLSTTKITSYYRTYTANNIIYSRTYTVSYSTVLVKPKVSKY